MFQIYNGNLESIKKFCGRDEVRKILYYFIYHNPNANHIEI